MQKDREQSSRVTAFLGVEPAPDGDLAGVAGRVGDIPPGILPIAGDEFGNYVCLDARDGRDGPVLFWDHEEGFDDDEVDFSNLYEIAPDLQSFLDGLVERRARRLPPARGRANRAGLAALVQPPLIDGQAFAVNRLGRRVTALPFALDTGDVLDPEPRAVY